MTYQSIWKRWQTPNALGSRCKKVASLVKATSKKATDPRYIDDIFSLWDISKPDIEAFIDQANLHQTSPNYQIHGRNIWHWDCVFRHGRIQRQKIQGKIYPWCIKTHFKKRKPSSTHISPLVTRRVLKKDLSKEKPWESYEQTPQKLRLRKILQISKNAWLTEFAHKLWKKAFYQI